MDLRDPIFNDENAAREHLESILWPNGPHCPHCGEVEKLTKLQGKSHRPGLWVCNSCRGHFTVTVGTVLERSKIPLSKWVLGFQLMASSKKGVSAHQLHRMLGITYKSAWFMAHRIREAMRPAGKPARMGGGGGMVEADETFIGRKKGAKVRHGYEHKMKVLSVVDRETGRAHSMVVEKLNTKTVRNIVLENIDREARLMTDEARHYVKVGREFADHQVVRHQDGEYGRGEAHTNTIEGFFSIFKRGMRGVYQHCSEEHLHRYLAEFDFRYSERAALGVDDAMRADKAVKGAAGKRLTYRRIDAR
jgi:transposase-like protein